MVDKVVAEKAEQEEESKGTNPSSYIVAPENDPISPEYKEVDDPDLVAKPVEFEEGEEGEPMTPGEVLKAEEVEKKKMEAEEKAKNKVEEERNKVIAKESIKKRAEAKEAAKKKGKGKTVVQETKAEEVERYKKILVSLGFDLQEAREEGKVQYALEYGELRIGRTFTEGFPTGKFWARKDGNFLDPPDVKELSVVKEFYAVRDGKKDIKDVTLKTVAGSTVAPTPEHIPGGNVVPYKKEAPPLINRKIGTMKLQKKGGYYSVAGHKEPDAWLVQQWGTEAGVTLTIKYAEQDDESAKAVVRAQLGDMFVEAAVVHYFKTTQDVITLETIDVMERRHKKPIVGIDPDGHPLLSTETLYEIYKRLIRFKNFSVRDAITKASRIATLKILNQDWREPEEIEAEAAEVRSVNAD
jgi:hypothetical protein